MSEVNLGTLYDMNKSAIATEKPLTDTEFKKALKIIKSFFKKNQDRYFMLLNRETYNFTMIDLDIKTDLRIARLINDIEECLNNRGKVISIEETKNHDAVEIWIKDKEETLVYYLFPYDIGVIS